MGGSLLVKTAAHRKLNGPKTGAVTMLGDQTPRIYETEPPVGVELIRRKERLLKAWVGGKKQRGKMQKDGEAQLGRL